MSIKITGEQMQDLNLHPADFHGEDWNYSQDFRFDPISRVDNAVKVQLIVGKSCRKRKS